MDKLDKFNIKNKLKSLAKPGSGDHYDASQAELNEVVDKVNEIIDTVDGITDGNTSFDILTEAVEGAGITIDGDLHVNAELTVDDIVENTLNSGVTIAGVLLKEGGIKLDAGNSSTPGATHTINKPSGHCIVTHGATAGLATLTVTITNSFVTAKSILFVAIDTYGGNGTPLVKEVTPSAGSIEIEIYNAHATDALSANFGLSFAILSQYV